jgi:hypothetical protein
MHDQPRRLRSTAVSLGLVGALALSLSACGSTSASATRRCVDETNIRLTDNAYPLAGDQQCLTSPAPSTAGSFGSAARYRYYYGGTVNNGYVYGGSFTVPTSTRSSTSRSRRWYNPGTWRSSNNSNTSSATSNSSSTQQSGVTTGGFGGSSGSSSKSSGS